MFRVTGQRSQDAVTEVAVSMWRGLAVLALIPLAGCGPSEQPPGPQEEHGTNPETSETATSPSISREVPPNERRSLGALSANELCGLISRDDFQRLGYPVGSSEVHEIGAREPARGCVFNAAESSESDSDSVLLAAQPEGYGQLGSKEVLLGSVNGTETLRANGCTVYAPVSGATLQITVTAPEADSEECDTAEAIAQYALPALAR